jgi:hypothetical protein
MTNKLAKLKSVIALFWLTAAQAGFAKPADWRVWADKLIVSLPAPPIWIINMSLAMNLTELRKALGDALDTLKEVSPAMVDDTLIGYIWWRFERHEVNLRDCLKLIGEAADAGSSRISCETVFALLNNLEANNQNEENVALRATELLSPLRRLAEEQWMEIQSCA